MEKGREREEQIKDFKGKLKTETLFDFFTMFSLPVLKLQGRF